MLDHSPRAAADPEPSHYTGELVREVGPARTGDTFYILLLVASLVATPVLLAMSGCSTPFVARAQDGLSPLEQSVDSVRILARCSRASVDYWPIGSGVVVRPDAVLTAAHVVDADCDYYVQPLDLPTMQEGNIFPVHVAVMGEVAGVLDASGKKEKNPNADDVALLVLDSETAAIPGYAPVLGPRPEPGETVCSAAAVPHRLRRCGTVLEPDSQLSTLIRSKMPMTKGNSGSGVYDRRGHLVGLARSMCTVKTCGEQASYATLLDLPSRRWFLAGK